MHALYKRQRDPGNATLRLDRVLLLPPFVGGAERRSAYPLVVVVVVVVAVAVAVSLTVREGKQTRTLPL